jgi:general secretion pathway protein D
VGYSRRQDVRPAWAIAIRRSAAFVAALALFGFGVAPVTAQQDSSNVPTASAPATSPPTPLAGKLPISTPLDEAPRAAQGSKFQLIEGTNQFINPQHKSFHTATSGDTTLDFADADVRDVVRSVLGDILQVPYAIDPQVSGHVTLKTGSPIARSDVLPALETALKVSGVALVLTNGIYNVVPYADAQHRAGQVRSGESGYGVEVVPLRFIAAEEMHRILTSLIPQGEILSTDTARNYLFLAGTEPERASMRETIALFDVDYLKSMSFAIIQPVHVDAESLASELDKVFEGTESPISGLVRFVPIARINSLLVVTPRASYLREVSEWVNRLDVPPVAPGRRLYYYRLQNARAGDIAQTLSQLFGGAGGQPRNLSSPSPAQQQMLSMPSAMNAMGPPPPQPTAPPVNAAPPGPVLSPSAIPLARADEGGGPLIVTDEPNNALIIRADQADYVSIERIIRAMDVAPDQVLIECTIAEVTLNDALKYGVEWYFKNASQTYNFSQTGTVSASFPGAAFSYVVPNVQVAVSALGTLSHVTILSSPRLLTLDNKAANIQVGDQVPVVTQTSQSVSAPGAPAVSTVIMQDTGVILSVTPRIGKSGMVFLDVSQQVSDAIPTTTSGIDSPTIEQRQIQTSVAIHDGQTIALGGLIQDTLTKSDSGIPFLKDIPYLGNLARSVDNERARTELLVFLTPRVVHDPADAQAMTDELTQGLDDVKKLLDADAKRRKK